MINFQIYKTHIKPIKPTLIKPVKPAGLGFMIKPGFYANPELVPDASRTACYYCPGPKAQVNTVLAVIDLEGISLSIWPKHTLKN